MFNTFIPFAQRRICLITSIEKFNRLIELEVADKKVKITTIRGDVYYCKVECPAEDEEDLAYHIITLEDPPRHFILECNFIKSIEEIEMSMSKTA